jgi:2-keto-3-deoxy-L-rhamnonate aldolase RhmA
MLASFTWPEPDGYNDSADANILVIAVIEEARAVERIDEIAATPGIDVLFVGTGDLSFSLGLRGKQNEPELEAAVAKVAEAGRRNGKFLGIPARNTEQVRRRQQQGFQMFQSMTELGLMSAGARQFLDPLGVRSSSRE